MNWMYALYATYEQNRDYVGRIDNAAISWDMPEKVIKNAGRIPHRNRFDMEPRYRNLLRRVNNILPFRRIPQH